MDVYAESGPEAYKLYLRMKQEGFRPDAFTYTSILNACASGTAAALKWGNKKFNSKLLLICILKGLSNYGAMQVLTIYHSQCQVTQQIRLVEFESR